MSDIKPFVSLGEALGSALTRWPKRYIPKLGDDGWSVFDTRTGEIICTGFACEDDAGFMANEWNEENAKLDAEDEQARGQP